MQLLQKQITKNSTNPKNIGFLELFLKIYNINTTKYIGSAASAISDATGDNSKATELAKAAKDLQAAIAIARAAKALDDSAKTAATTPLLGFYAEAKAERNEIQTSTETNTSTAKKSSIVATGGDVNLTAGEKVNIIGSDIGSQIGDVTLAGKAGVDVVSADELNSLKNSSAHNSQTVSIGSRGMDGSYSDNTSATTGTGKTNADSTISAQNGTFKVTTEKDFNFSGAQGIANDVDLTEVNGNTTISSKSDTHTQETNSQSMSVGKKVSYGISQDKQISQAVTHQTMLIGTQSVKTAGDQLTLNGAVLANATIETDSNGNAKLVDQGNMTVANSSIEVTDIKSTVAKTSEGYGLGKGQGTTQVNFGKDSELTETTSHGAMGSYTKINTDGTSQTVAATTDLNKTQEVTKTEISKGKASLDVDDEAVTNTVDYANKAAKNLVNAGNNANAIIQRSEAKVGNVVTVASKVISGEIKTDQAAEYYNTGEQILSGTYAINKDKTAANAINNVLTDGEKTKPSTVNDNLTTGQHAVQDALDVKQSQVYTYNGNALTDPKDAVGANGINKANAAAIRSESDGSVGFNTDKANLTNGSQVYGTMVEETVHGKQAQQGQKYDSTNGTDGESEKLAKFANQTAQAAWKMENNINGNTTGTNSTISQAQTDFVSNNNDSLTLKYGTQKAASVTNPETDTITYLVPSSVGYMGHTGKYFQDGTTGKWYQSDLAIASTGFSAVDTLKTIASAVISSDPSKVDLVGKGFYNVRPTEPSFDPQKFMAEHPETATYYPTTQKQDEYIYNETKKKERAINYNGELYGLKNNNCNETEYGILNKAGVNTSKVVQTVPIIQWSIEKTKEMYYEQLGLEGLRKQANTHWQPPRN